MWYLAFSVILAAVLVGFIVWRHRSASNPIKSVDSFAKAREALKPDPKKEKKSSQ